MNYACSTLKESWFSHPIIGDCSFDSFQRFNQNPIFSGKGLWEWPVNGFFFEDPVSKNWYVYISLYAKGYTPVGTILLMRSMNQGESWENLGPVFDALGMDIQYGAAGAVDASIVYDQGIYHMVYGWCTSDLTSDGGLAYASAAHPEGPFHRAAHPLTREQTMPLMNGLYKRTYASTLLKRKQDWLILTMMSTPGNSGGSWALTALTAKQPEGPYQTPQMLLYPQSKLYHPSPIEFYPAFTYDGQVYAPATSVGKNRSYQAIFTANLEEAHLPSGWHLFQEGSNWHSVDQESEKYGIWGQTYSGAVINKRFYVMYPSKDHNNRGTINMASRPWDQPFSDYFVLSANNGTATSFLKKGFQTFSLSSVIHSTGDFSIVWGWNGPVGSQVAPRWADSLPHENMFSSFMRLAVQENKIQLSLVDSQLEERVWCEKKLDYSFHQPVRVHISQKQAICYITINELEIKMDHSAKFGRIGLIAADTSILTVKEWKLDVEEEQDIWIDYLPTEGLMGAGQNPSKWEHEEGEWYKHGFGYCSTQKKGYVQESQSVLKWNFQGKAFRLWMPVLTPCKLRLELDGEKIEDISLLPDETTTSRVIAEMNGLPNQNHALSITLLEGILRCDTLQVLV